MSRMSPHLYTRDHVIRDIVYFYYLCEQYHSLPTSGALFGVVLDGPYHAFFVGNANDDPADAEDRLVHEGSLLIFLGMLDDWDAGAGYYFKEIARGWEDNSLTDYLPALLRAYQHAQDARDDRITYLCEEALALLAHIEMSGQWRRELAALDPHLWGQVRTIVRERGLIPPAARLAQRNVYDEFPGKFFAERCP
jgi:hypothetical protein